ncbi:hypothetical protein DRP53_02910 [candidate division WOR-3 bacterium]|uniref:Single cache domain-containing protein n=1 Tax=candidate division WOR-3 bacterium TaxID=2052148 RepID=A0A660SLR3_UNCW3|nr:MAG: hypothetical protein DRP53_02910 [candidate division WOR-3 bacterium]
MHRGRFFIVTFIGVFIIGIAATVITKFLGTPQKINITPIQDATNRFGVGIARLIANSGFTEDAYLLNDASMLGEYTIRFKRSSPNFRKIIFLDSTGKVISSSDPSLVGKPYRGDINLGTLKSKGSMSVAKEGYSIYGAPINIQNRNYGYVITEITNKISAAPPPEENLPLKLLPGIVIALVGGLIFGVVAMSLSGRIAEDVAEELAAQQEAVFSPKVRRLKEELESLKAQKEEIESRIKAGEDDLADLNRKKEELDQKLREHPVVKSIDKLKASEAKLMEDLKRLKEEKEKLEEEKRRLESEREEILRKIEIDRQEEKTLHEKLELIKKKILKLE